MINILFLLSHTEKGGGEVVIYNLVKNIDRNQFRPFVGHLDFRKGEFIHEFNKLGVPAYDFGASHLRNLPVTIAVVFRLARFIRDNSIDIVFTSGAYNHIYAALAKRIKNIPLATYVMNYYQGRLRDNPLIMRLALKLGADYYLVDSLSCLEPLKKLIPAAIPNKVVYQGVDKDFIYGEDKRIAVRKHLGLKDSDKLVSIVARLQRWKGQDVFLRAAHLILTAYPQAYFCIVGGALFGMEESYSGELKQLIGKLGLSQRCRMVGHQDNVRDWISASDIIVHASRAPEPGALAIMEAMCLGKPVVATSCGAPSELIKDGLTGILCKPDSPEDLASKIKLLLDDGNLADRIGGMARDFALGHFTAERMAGEIEDEIKTIIPDARKCVIFTLSTCKKGGQEMSMRNIIKVLDIGKIKPIAVFLCLKEEGNLPEDLRRMGVEVFIRRIGRLRQPFNVLRTIIWLSNLIKKKNAKLVFSSGGHNHSYSRIGAAIANRPAIVYETFIFKRHFWQAGPIYTLNFLLGSNAYISSGKLASETLQQAALWKPPVYYLPHMVDLDVFDYRKSGTNLRQHLNIPMNAFVFSMVARIEEWKGQDIFIEAAIQILKEAQGVYFLIFGEPTFDKDKVYLDFLKKKVDSSGFAERIIFAGFLEDSSYAYAASDVICHCSKTQEPFGMVVIEAFAMKKPVIATAIGGPIESVEPGRDGWLISPGNARQLVLSIKCCLEKKDNLALMGEYGYQKVKKNYSQEQFAIGINSIISKYIKN